MARFVQVREVRHVRVLQAICRFLAQLRGVGAEYQQGDAKTVELHTHRRFALRLLSWTSS